MPLPDGPVRKKRPSTVGRDMVLKAVKLSLRPLLIVLVPSQYKRSKTAQAPSRRMTYAETIAQRGFFEALNYYRRTETYIAEDKLPLCKTITSPPAASAAVAAKNQSESPWRP